MTENIVSNSNKVEDHEIDHFFDSFDKEISACAVVERSVELRELITTGLRRMYQVGYKQATEDSSLHSSSQEDGISCGDDSG